MGTDLRQLMAAILTFSMFVMLGNMIKRDHLDPLLETLIFSPGVQYGDFKGSKPGMLKLTEKNYGPWMEHGVPRKRCWKKPSIRKEQSNGYIFLTLTHGPEYHASELTNAVVVARHLGATLALPDITGTKVGEKRHFGEIYDVDKFMTSLNGVIRVDTNPPAELSNGTLPIVEVPDRISEEFISSNINPIFQSERNLKIVTYFNTSNVTNGKENKLSNTYRCLATFESLQLQPEFLELVDSMVQTLRSLSQKMNGRYLAVDLKVEKLEKTSCQEANNASNWCYNAEEIGEFLKKIGFHKETTIYLTQSGWHSSLNALRNVFPNTFTKDAIMPADEKAKFVDSKIHEYEKFIDYYMCSEGDVFVPAYQSRFYEGVVGERIGLGKMQILIPAKNVSASANDHISPYVVEKSHFAHACFCGKMK